MLWPKLYRALSGHSGQSSSYPCVYCYVPADRQEIQGKSRAHVRIFEDTESNDISFKLRTYDESCDYYESFLAAGATKSKLRNQ